MKIVSFFCVQSRTILLYLQFLNQKIYSNDITVKSSLAILVLLLTLLIFVNVPSRKRGMADDSFSCCISYSTLHHGYLCFMFFWYFRQFVELFCVQGLSFHHPKQKHSFSVCPIVFKLTFSHQKPFPLNPVVADIVQNTNFCVILSAFWGIHFLTH